AGNRYYIEAIHKEAKGNDNLAVGWTLPDGTQERPIPGERLIPFGETGQAASALLSNNGNRSDDEFTESANAQLILYPNPTQRGEVTVQLAAVENDGGVINLVVIGTSGNIVYRKEARGSETQSTMIFTTDGTVAPGVYLVKIARGKTNYSKR